MIACNYYITFSHKCQQYFLLIFFFYTHSVLIFYEIYDIINTKGMIPMEFSGFSDKTLKYLNDIVVMNDRKWYEEHKPDYNKYIKEPFYELIELLTPTIRKIDPQLITDPKKCLSRIYRDARRVKGGCMYRDHVWLVFKRQQNDTLFENPSFYFEITPYGCSCGMGFYCAHARIMEKWRNYIAENPRAFEEAIDPIEESEILDAHGQSYARPKPDCPPGLEKWYNFKTFFINTDMDISFIKSPDLADFLAEQFNTCAPLYKILSDEILNKDSEFNDTGYIYNFNI